MRSMRTAQARATEPKPGPFLLNLFRSPQTYLRNVRSLSLASPKESPAPPGGAFAFRVPVDCRQRMGESACRHWRGRAEGFRTVFWKGSRSSAFVVGRLLGKDLAMVGQSPVQSMRCVPKQTKFGARRWPSCIILGLHKKRP
jgi:hypothetical protein